MESNFGFLEQYWPDLAQIGSTAELYLYTDANACVYKLGLLAESIAKKICLFEKIDLPIETSNMDRLHYLREADLLPEKIDTIFYTLRKSRNKAVHTNFSSQNDAKILLQMAFHLSCWFMEVYGDWKFEVPEYKEPNNISTEVNFKERMMEQEKRIEELMNTVEEMKTAASDINKKERLQKATEVAEKMSVLDGEVECIEKDLIRLEIVSLPIINYASQQNGIPAVKKIIISNNSEKDLENVKVRLVATPEFMLSFEKHIDRLRAHEVISFESPTITLNGEFLVSITERVKSILNISLEGDNEVLASDSVEITILPFDQWAGISYYPELLASFITPNHPEVAKIIARATEILGEWTQDTSMDAYQTQDPNRVLSQAGAIYTALQELEIAYAVPPASFEISGQRVRLCDTILQQKLGTCLDLTLLYAACLESVGLRTILIITQNHIFSGIWLQDTMFSEAVLDDASLLTKRLAAGVNEICVVESTGVTSGSHLTFDNARSSAEDTLWNKDIEYIIDVQRARLSGAFPLPIRVSTGEGWKIEHNNSVQNPTLNVPQKLGETIDTEIIEQKEDIPKKTMWERKLLDIGLRNTLINLRLTRNVIPILTHSLDKLEDYLADGSDFQIVSKPNDWDVTDFSFESFGRFDNTKLLEAEFKNKRLRSVCTDIELEKLLKNIYRSSKTALEENGANTLYLALGMLRWYETSRSVQARYAPIILIPIEIIRKSSAQGYVIRLRDDEPQMNITLLEKIRQDFKIEVKGVDPLPLDEHGIDIRKVLTIMRKTIMEQPRWDILEVATLGIFSFSQFVMWNDIRNRTDDLMNNKIVRSLIDGKLCWDAKPLEISSKVNEDGMLFPMPADASQLFAIEAACEDQSFVLHGPPGTGKSQTITSLIINALAKGKTVLFVAEKMAALEVVESRLNKMGVGPFCLELHSNKSKKKDVLEQLRMASEVSKSMSPEMFEEKARQISEIRKELDEYAEALHKKQKCGKTLYELINEYEIYKDAPDLPYFSNEFIESLDYENIENQKILLERLIAAGKEVGHPHNNVLKEIGCTQYSQQLKSKIAPITRAYMDELEKISNSFTKLNDIWEFQTIRNPEDLENIYQLSRDMVLWFDFPQCWAKTQAPEVYFRAIEEMSIHYAKASELRKKLLQSFNEDIFNQDGNALFSEYMQIVSKWALPRFFGLRKLKKRLDIFASHGFEKSKLKESIILLRDYQNEMKSAKSLFDQYGCDLENLYEGDKTDWNRISVFALQALESSKKLKERFLNYDFQCKHCGNLSEKGFINEILNNYSTLCETKQNFVELLQIDELTKENWLEEQHDMCIRIINNLEEIKEWITFQGIAKDVENIGLKSVLDIYREGSEHDKVIASYFKVLLYGLIVNTIDKHNSLNEFSGAVFNEKIEQYKKIDMQWRELSQKEAYYILASKVPNFTAEAAHSSELGILQRCIKSGGRGISIRALFDQIPTLLPRLCPCMLMSPISAAQYLDPKREPFDLVVFDEASQLTTCKAVGVLARGKNAVIVGDPKQMPPTSFFTSSTEDEEHMEAEDMESILDDCLALNMPQAHLLWHYRSRHESLIAFSNRHFYENKLFTFPSVNDREARVKLVCVDGAFDRGKTRTNHKEAVAVVEELKRRFREKINLSIGIVTFNKAQQNLIDDMINEVCATDIDFEEWIYNSEEPIFIKNLENVQGDERDVILFSIGYGPDKNGKVTMNFGPLNREGGWRRLNVAVTRARSEMIVYSTLTSDRIDLSKTKSEGVAALKAFLEYADGRKNALNDVTLNYDNTGKEGIAQSICKALEEKGYKTDLSVGHSKYRVDIGVTDPHNSEKYLLGIILDGFGYGSAKTTRDRELAQVSVLNSLGWSILRVWCMEWWDNPQKEIRRIFKKISEIESGNCNLLENEVIQEDKNSIELCVAEVEKGYSEDKNTLGYEAPHYGLLSLNVTPISADAFVSDYEKNNIKEMVIKTLEKEAPISSSQLMKRVTQNYGIGRVGRRIQDYMDSLFAELKLTKTKESKGTFYWREDQVPEEYIGFRVCKDNQEYRDIRDISTQEIANAIYVVLYEQMSMSHDDLLREAAKKLGYVRMVNNVMEAMEHTLKFAQRHDCIKKLENKNIVLTEKGTDKAISSINLFKNILNG